MQTAREFAEAMGRDWWDGLEYSDKVRYHAKVVLEENWAGDWGVLIDEICQGSDMSRTEALLFMLLTRIDRLQGVMCGVHGVPPIGYHGPPGEDNDK